MATPQPGILPEPPPISRYLTFQVLPDATAEEARGALRELTIDTSIVVGLGPSTVRLLGAEVAPLHELPAMSGPGVVVPTTPAGLWIWLRGATRGEMVHRTLALETLLGAAFELEHVVDAFRHGEGPPHDLTGYEDGTENPEGDEAVAAAFATGLGGLDGSSFVVAQEWQHDLEAFGEFSPAEQDAIFGRRKSDNEEIADAPESAHVKRTEQEAFDPPTFVIRRSSPYTRGEESGLYFVAFGASLDAFERQMRRMVGEDDGLVDALFRFSVPISGCAAWCPPIEGARLVI